MPRSTRQPDASRGSEKRSTVVRVRVTVAEKALAHALAERLGVTVSSAICASVRWAAGTSPGRLEPFLDEIAAQRLELRRIGVNLNQLAHAANSNRRVTLNDALLLELRELVGVMAQFMAEVQDANHARIVGLDGTSPVTRQKGARGA